MCTVLITISASQELMKPKRWTNLVTAFRIAVHRYEFRSEQLTTAGKVDSKTAVQLPMPTHTK